MNLQAARRKLKKSRVPALYYLFELFLLWLCVCVYQLNALFSAIETFIIFHIMFSQYFPTPYLYGFYTLSKVY